MTGQKFSDYALTDKGFAACLTAIDYGYQIVAKTEYACDAIKIVSSRDIFGQEANDIRKYTEQKRETIRISYGKRRTRRCYPVLIMKSAKRRETCMNI